MDADPADNVSNQRSAGAAAASAHAAATESYIIFISMHTSFVNITQFSCIKDVSSLNTVACMVFMVVLQTRVRLGFGRDNTFIPTTNVRNPHMLEEAEAFSQQLRDFQRAVNEYHRNVQGIQLTVQCI